MNNIIPPKVVDLFCGIGGASLGFKQAGYDITLGLDINQIASNIFKKNIEAEVIIKDIKQYTAQECLKDSHLRKGELDVLICCPPCQGFSRIRKNGNKDPRNDLVITTANFVVEMKPKIIIFENVPGILNKDNITKFKKFINVLEENKYHFQDDHKKNIVNAANYGIPQTRKRLILIATHNSIKKEIISFPPKTHSKKGNHLQENLEKWKTVEDAIGDLEQLESGEHSKTDQYHKAPNHQDNVLKIIQNIKHNGGSRSELPKELVLKCHKNFEGHQDVYGRMDKNKPAPTLTAGWHTPSKGRYIHPEQDRGLTVREACRLQTFPDNYDFNGAYKQQITQFIGNAVPVEWMRIIAKHIAKEMNWTVRLESNNDTSFWNSLST